MNKRINGKWLFMIFLLMLTFTPSALANETGEEIGTELISDPYRLIIETYIKASDENWSVEELKAHNMFYDLSGFGIKLDQLGFNLTDLNEDGINELLIGICDTNPDSIILDFYTEEDNEAIHLGVSEARDYYFLTHNNKIGNVRSGGANFNVIDYYELKQNKLNYIEGLLYDKTSNSQSYTYLLKTFYDEPDSKDGESISLEDYNQIKDVTYAPENINYKSIFDYNIMVLTEEPREPIENVTFFTMIRNFFVKIFSIFK